MDVIRQRPSGSAPTSPGLARLGVDLEALAGRGDVLARRRGVTLRLVAAGVTPELLEALLPGWRCYLDPASTDGAVA